MKTFTEWQKEVNDRLDGFDELEKIGGEISRVSTIGIEALINRLDELEGWRKGGIHFVGSDDKRPGTDFWILPVVVKTGDNSGGKTRYSRPEVGYLSPDESLYWCGGGWMANKRSGKDRRAVKVYGRRCYDFHVSEKAVESDIDRNYGRRLAKGERRKG